MRRTTGRFGGAADAADLLPPAPRLPPPPVEEFSGWYLRGDVGLGFASQEPRGTRPTHRDWGRERLSFALCGAVVQQHDAPIRPDASHCLARVFSFANCSVVSRGALASNDLRIGLNAGRFRPVAGRRPPVSLTLQTFVRRRGRAPIAFAGRQSYRFAFLAGSRLNKDAARVHKGLHDRRDRAAGGSLPRRLGQSAADAGPDDADLGRPFDRRTAGGRPDRTDDACMRWAVAL